MPELPEVETIRRQLDSVLRKKKITGIEIRLPKLIKGPFFNIKKIVTWVTVERIIRRAKLLIVQLSNSYSLIIHLKMTGQLIYKHVGQLKIGGHPIKGGANDLPNKFTQAIFTFSDSSKLFFNDIRKFGYFRLIQTNNLDDLFRKENFGPEPLDDAFTLEVFKRLLSRRKKAKIKQLIMDQTQIAGLGNIYATEVCFYAGIRPTRVAGRLSKKEQEKLFNSIIDILKNAVKKQGTSSNTYVDAYGQPGKYVPLLRVYGRKGESCYKCKTTIKSINLGGRGTTFCPKCQRR